MRSKLLKITSLLMILILCMAVVVPGQSATILSRNTALSNTLKPALELEGINCGYLYSFAGGTAYGELLTSATGVDSGTDKFINNITYHDIVITFGGNMSSELYQWIETSFNGKNTGNDIFKNGAIVLYDYNYKEISRLNFSDAVIHGITFPEVDASSKTPVRITLAISPGSAKKVAGSGKTASSITSSKANVWTVSNFKFAVDGFTKSLNRMTKVSEITITKPIDKQTNIPFRPEYSNIILTLSDSGNEEMMNWYNTFVSPSSSSNSMERSGTLSYLSSDLRNTYLTSYLENMGIIDYVPDEVSNDGIPERNAKYELYCENIGINFGP